MEISVPNDLPVLDAKTEAEINGANIVPDRPLEQKKDLEARAREYFEQKEVVPMLNALLTDVFVQQPDDPIDHMMKFLLRHPALPDLIANSSQQDLLENSDAAVAYSNRFKLPQLFDEMLSALLEDAPDDAGRFALTWMRWNKNGFIARNAPEGYRAYSAAKDSSSK
jgi:hypothetical protein